MAGMTPKLVVPGRPEAGEYSEYHDKYIALVPGTDILGALEAQRLVMAQLLGARSEREGNFRYAADKWSVKEVIGHVTDSERIFAYRALRFARADNTPLGDFYFARGEGAPLDRLDAATLRPVTPVAPNTTTSSSRSLTAGHHTAPASSWRAASAGVSRGGHLRPRAR